MNKKFEGWLIVSDVDNTLLYNFDQIPERNLEAIARFEAQGGRFTLATGRNLQSVERVAARIPFHTPLVLANGGCIYDIQKGETLYSEYLPGTALEYLRELAESPAVECMRIMAAGDKTYTVYHSPTADFSSPNYPAYPTIEASLAAPPGFPWQKAVMFTQADSAQSLRAFAARKRYPGVSFVISSPTLCEMVPAGVDKGAGMLRLARMLGVPRERLVAVGDYENDLPMVREAGLGVCPANALDEVRRAAGLVLCDCREGAIAELVDYLDSHIP